MILIVLLTHCFFHSVMIKFDVGALMILVFVLFIRIFLNANTLVLGVMLSRQQDSLAILKNYLQEKN